MVGQAQGQLYPVEPLALIICKDPLRLAVSLIAVLGELREERNTGKGS